MEPVRNLLGDLDGPAVLRQTAVKIPDAEVLWFDKALFEACGLPDVDAVTIKDKFAYGIKTTPIYSDVKFDLGDQVTIAAERYGGGGTGRHGGGARVANLGGFQLKGVGRNRLAGPARDTLDGKFHEYGALSLVDGICEVIATSVMRQVLPLGAVECLALLMIDEKSALYPARWDASRSAGAILVREACLRPAHFLPNGSFELTAELLFECGSDATRVRYLNHRLGQSLKTTGNVVQFFASFLSSCARQLTRARSWRCNHGALSPSNIAIDGRWIDIGWSSILTPGLDYARPQGTPPFSLEIDYPKIVVSEWAYTFSKYQDVGIDTGSLFRFYDQRVEAENLRSAAETMGLKWMPLSEDSISAELTKLSQYITVAIGENLQLAIDDIRDYNAELDPLLKLAKDAFGIGLETTLSAAKSSVLTRVMYLMWGESGFKRQTFSTYKLHVLTRCLRRVVYSPYFSRGRMAGQASSLVLNRLYSEVPHTTRRWSKLAAWVFNLEDERQVILDYGGVSIHLEMDGAVFIKENDCVRKLTGRRRFLDVIDELETMDACRLKEDSLYGYPAVRGFDFRAAALIVLKGLNKAEERLLQ